MTGVQTCALPISAVVAAASCTTTLAGAGGPAAADGGHPGPTPTLAEIFLSDGNQFDLNPFDHDIVTETVLLFPELVAAASDPDAELTVFLSNDWAFRRLVADLTERARTTTAEPATSLWGSIRWLKLTDSPIPRRRGPSRVPPKRRSSTFRAAPDTARLQAAELVGDVPNPAPPVRGSRTSCRQRWGVEERFEDAA